MGRNDGFTLLEIAIVVILVALMSSLLVPALQRARRAAVRPATQPPTSVPVQVNDAFALVDETFRALPPASIAFNPSRRMHFERTERVIALVSASMTADELTNELQQRAAKSDPVSARSIRIAPQMELRLTGDAFRIEPITPPRQAVGTSGAVEWSWTVTPVKHGAQKLYLSVDAIVTIAGKESPRSLRVLEQPIDVQITAGERVTTFTAGNWQFVVGTIVIPLLAWGWARRHPAP
jgi:prepilin-type N-terminal cleavage/methylation domain-containing protein